MSIQISVVIPVYNSARTILQCMESVVSDLQITPYTWEIVLVDDGSKDDSAAIMRNYIDRSPYKNSIRLILQPNGGAASARNSGIKASTGKYIAFNDSDDMWMHGKTLQQMQYLLENPHVDMICGAHEYPYRPIFKKMKEYTRITIKDIIFQNFCSPPTLIIKRAILSKTGLFDENMKNGSEEGSLFLPFTYYGYCVLHNRVYARSITQKKKWGDSGLSGNVWGMEKGELYNFLQSYRHGYISMGSWILCSSYSFLKFIWRFLFKYVRKISN